MRLAFETSLLRSLSVESALREISRAGFEYVEIGLAHFSLADSSDEEAKEISDLLSDYGLKLASLCGIFGLSNPEEEGRLFAIEQAKKAITRAQNLGCKLIVSELDGDYEAKEESKKAFEKSLDEFIPLLESAGVTMCFEAHPGDFIEDNKAAVDLLKKVDSKFVRYLYCIPHSFILGRDVHENVTYSRDVLGYLHVADSLRPERTFFSGRYSPKVKPHQHLIPGYGDIDIHSILVSLKEINYQGYLTLDPFSHFDRPIEAMKESKEKTESLLQTI